MTEEEKSKLTGRARSLANLSPPFKKGQSGNPAGRKKKEETWQKILKEIFKTKLSLEDLKKKGVLDQQIDLILGPNKKTVSLKRIIAAKTVLKLLLSKDIDIYSLDIIMNRTDGLKKQNVVVSRVELHIDEDDANI